MVTVASVLRRRRTKPTRDLDRTTCQMTHQNPVYTTKTYAPDGGYGWVIVAGSFYCFLILDGVIACFGLYLSELVKEFKESEGRISWVGSILAGFTMLVGPLGGALVNKYGCRITCIAGSILTSTSLAVSVFCPTVTWLMIAYAFAGAGFGLVIIPEVVIVGDYFESKRRLASGIAMTGAGVGTCVVPPLINYVVIARGWRAGSLCLAALTLGGVLCGALNKPIKNKTVVHGTYDDLMMSPLPNLMKNVRRNSTIDVSFSNKTDYMVNRQKTENQSYSLANRRPSTILEYYVLQELKDQIEPMVKRGIFNSDSTTKYNKTGGIRNSPENVKPLLNIGLFKNPKFILFIMMNISGMVAFYIPFLFLAAHVKKSNNFDGSFLLSVTGIVYAISQLCLGYTVHFPAVDPLLVNTLCMLVGAIAVGSIPFCVSYTSYIFASLFFGITIASFVSLAPVIIVELFGLENLSSGFGTIFLFRGMAAFLGCPISGALVDATQSFKIAFFLGGVLFLISSIIGFVLLCIKRQIRVTDTHM